MIRAYFIRTGLFASLVFFSACQSRAPEPARVDVIALPEGGMVPDAERDSGGLIHVAYLADADVYYMRSDDDGESFSDPIRVNTEPGFASGGRYRGPDLAVGKDGTVHVAWYNDAYRQQRPREEWGVMYARLLPGEPAFEPARNLNHVPSDNYAVAADGNGGVSVLWMAEGIFLTRSSDEGGSFGPSEPLDADPCECCGSRMLYADDGSLLALYRDKAENIRDMYLARVQEAGAPSTRMKLSQTSWHIEACPMTGGFLHASSAGLLAGWETDGTVSMARVSEEDLSLLSGEIYVTNQGKYPVVLNAERGTSLVAWKSGSRLEWQSLDAEGTPLGPRGVAESGNPHRPAGVVTGDGRVLLFP